MGEQASRCAATDCSRRARTAGLCAMHYWRASEGLAEAGEIPPTLDAAQLEALTLCSVDGCERPRDTRGLCTMHYCRKRNNSENWDDPNPWRSKNAAKRGCSVEGCKRWSEVKGLCKLHYTRKLRGDENWNDPEPHKPGRKPSPACSVDDCGRRTHTRGLCVTHLRRKRSGDPRWDDPIPRPRSRPPKEEKRRQGPVSAEAAAKLRADYAMARRVNGSTPQDSPDREANRRFNDRIASLAAAGHTHAQIAQAAGASIHMVRRRIARIRVEAGLAQPLPCGVDGCDRLAYAAGLCRLHYGRRRAGNKNWNDPAPRGRIPSASATVELCSNGHPRTPDNLSVRADGVKRCKACKREAQRRSVPNQRLEITPGMHGTATGWRYGCRCGGCRQQHSQDSQERRWMAVYGPGGRMEPKVRERILRSLERTANVKATADEVGVMHQAIYRACSAVPGFGILVRKLIEPRELRLK